jgi:predicted Rossmann fold nucleotide-binding protein DprA/Smf involved in DNA uptake
MKLAVVGSRDFPDEESVRSWVRTHAHRFDSFISGGAKGPDTWALEAWREVMGTGS